MRLQLKRSNVLASGSAKTPTASQLEYGELAINYNTDDPAIFLKDSNNNVIRISGVGNIADDGQVELPATTTPPSNPQSGNLWYNSDDGRLYIYYTDADSSQWVDASPDSWDPTVLPDTTNSNSQSGTLDDRYLMLNSGNDPITGGLNITGGNVGIGTSSPAQALDVVGSVKSSNQFIGPTAALGSSATNPTYSFSGQQTGMFLAASNAVGFSTGGSERVRINSGGNVGIGTSSPSRLVHIKGSGNEQQNLFLESTTTNSRIEFINTQTTSTGNRVAVGARNDSFSVNIGSSLSTKLVVNPNGNVGIGTTSPASKLHLSEGTGSIINLGTGTSTASSTQGLNFYGRFINGVTPAAPGQLTSFIREERQGVDAEFDLTFGTGDTSDATEKIRLTSSGNVGIGSSDPVQKLHVEGTSNDTIDETTGTLRLQASGGNGLLFGTRASGPYQSYIQSAFVADTSVARYDLLLNPLGGNVGIGTSTPASRLQIGDNTNNTDNVIVFGRRVAATQTNKPRIGQTSDGTGNDLGLCATSSSGGIRFFTGNGDEGFGAGSNIERMRIDSDGNILIGQTSSNQPGNNNTTAGIGFKKSTSGVRMHLNMTGTTGLFVGRNNNGTCTDFRRAGVQVGRILINTSSVSYSTSSDYRLKENVVVLDNAIDRVKELLPKRFNFINDPLTVDGFLAHEAQTVVPEAVEGSHNETEPIGTLTEWDGTVIDTDVTEPGADEMSWETTDTDEDGNETTVTRTRTWTQTGSRPAYQSIDQAKLVPLLTAALQEAITRIEALENAQ
jgi:hypothetical protein